MSEEFKDPVSEASFGLGTVRQDVTKQDNPPRPGVELSAMLERVAYDCTPSSSTSKISVAFGPIGPPWVPLSP